LPKSSYIVLAYTISYFHNLTLMTYENKLKTAYEHVISCFHKLLPNKSLTTLMPVYKSKYINPNTPKTFKIS